MAGTLILPLEVQVFMHLFYESKAEIVLFLTLFYNWVGIGRASGGMLRGDLAGEGERG